ncbi:MAG: hypothetical protein H7332_02720, partial [Bdellovibrionales bacterium]|nr:hypothetical protein [Ramlibacter sp.]
MPIPKYPAQPLSARPAVIIHTRQTCPPDAGSLPELKRAVSQEDANDARLSSRPQDADAPSRLHTPLVERRLSRLDTSSVGAIKQALMLLATLIGTASAHTELASPHETLNSKGAEPPGFLDDLIPVLHEAGTRHFFVERSLGSASHAEAFSAALWGGQAAGIMTCGIGIHTSEGMADPLADVMSRPFIRPVAEGFSSKLFGDTPQLGKNPKGRFIQLLINPGAKLRLVSDRPGSNWTATRFLNEVESGVTSISLGHLLYRHTALNEVEIPWEGTLHKLKAEAQTTQEHLQEQANTFDVFKRASKAGSAALVITTEMRDLHDSVLAYVTGQGYVGITVLLCEGVNATVFTAAENLPVLIRFGKRYGSATVWSRPAPTVTGSEPTADPDRTASQPAGSALTLLLSGVFAVAAGFAIINLKAMARRAAEAGRLPPAPSRSATPVARPREPGTRKRGAADGKPDARHLQDDRPLAPVAASCSQTSQSKPQVPREVNPKLVSQQVMASIADIRKS